LASFILLLLNSIYFAKIAYPWLETNLTGHAKIQPTFASFCKDNKKNSVTLQILEVLTPKNRQTPYISLSKRNI
ncbi:hypothetical protein, partial [Barnesiella intestinihominis]|uniref:hypothetical protein n=2 Tax=Barnesiella intestinihominis TaxID=487174 RepID=UPI0039708389